jgi:hypothetical protein
MCLTGVHYFSTLGYQPGIAFLAAGALSPIATLVLILLTLFGALPMYRRVAAESPHGDGSISMLENLLSRWKGKLFVLALLGFATTSFIITITLSAADATAHIVENPFVIGHLDFLHHRIAVTLVLITALGAIFLRGFKEAIGIAVFLVVIYLALNLAVVAVGFYQIATNATLFWNWKQVLFGTYSSPFLMSGTALLVFPKLALGLSGFETGVVVMPLVKGDVNGNAPHIESQHLTRPGESAFLLFLRNETGKLPHVYFGWSEGNPVSYLLKYIAFVEGDTAPVTHEVLRQAEKDPDQRPIVHVGG